jgi:hypothetical protein
MEVMQVISMLQEASLQGSAQGKENCENILTAQKAEVARADIDAAFESACRLIVTEIFAWMDRRDLRGAFAVSSTRFRAG